MLGIKITKLKEEKENIVDSVREKLAEYDLNDSDFVRFCNIGFVDMKPDELKEFCFSAYKEMAAIDEKIADVRREYNPVFGCKSASANHGMTHDDLEDLYS